MQKWVAQSQCPPPSCTLGFFLTLCQKSSDYGISPCSDKGQLLSSHLWWYCNEAGETVSISECRVGVNLFLHTRLIHKTTLTLSNYETSIHTWKSEQSSRFQTGSGQGDKKKSISKLSNQQIPTILVPLFLMTKWCRKLRSGGHQLQKRAQYPVNAQCVPF